MTKYTNKAALIDSQVIWSFGELIYRLPVIMTIGKSEDPRLSIKLKAKKPTNSEFNVKRDNGSKFLFQALPTMNENVLAKSSIFINFTDELIEDVILKSDSLLLKKNQTQLISIGLHNSSLKRGEIVLKINKRIM